MTYVLDKLKFVGNLDLSVPNCVLFEIAQNRNVNVDENKIQSLRYRTAVYKLIESGKATAVSQPFTASSLSEIAAFLNPNSVKWSGRTVIEAFKIVWNKYWSKRPTIDVLNDDTLFDYSTPLHPDSVSPVVLYVILRDMGVKATHTTTLGAMIETVQCARMSRSKVLRHISVRLGMYKTSGILSAVVLLADAHERVNGYNSETVSSTIDLIPTKDYLRSNITPRTHEEAIAAAILYHNTDISMSKSPLKEYASLVTNRPYVDTTMRDLVASNKDVFDTRLSFNPKLPDNAYNMASLLGMLRREGITTSDSPSALQCYGKLSFKYSIPRFHYDVVRGIRSFETAIDLEDVRVCHSPRVSYGCERDGYDVHLASELVECFRENNLFINPRSGGESYDADAIHSLKKVCKYARDRDTAWENLLQTIVSIEDSLRFGMIECERQLLAKYSECNDEEKVTIKNLLYYILYAGLTMRGWDGKSEWPIKHVQKVEGDKNIVDAASDYLEFILKERDRVGALGHYVMRLPLLYISKNGLYVNTDGERGLTIQGRIYIVLSRESIHSCTMMSSNYLVLTSHHYLSILGENFPFTPRDVAII